ncbi:MAG: alpha/beta fold hydrolase [Rhodospirillaceae bacterium]|nr:alpha/beta fold hydrolase [Rhodospirillaceae bacterium]
MLRQRLEAPRLTLWATSYGTHLALAYLKQFPDRVGALVLHGVEGLDHTLKRPVVVDADLADLARRLSSGDNLPRDFVNEVATLVDKLRDTPRTASVDGDEVTIGPFDLQLFVAAQMGTAASRARLVAALDVLAADDYAPVARFARSYRENRRDNLMGIATDCASGASEARHAAILTDLESAVTGNAINYPFPEICATVPFTDLGQEFRAPVASNVRALFISGTLDGRTPVSNAEEVLGGLPRGEHLIVDGAGHVDEIFISSPVILETVLAFLREEPLPTNRITAPFGLLSADR